jgi:hypothetical protein
MGLAIRSIKMKDGSYDLCPKLICDWCRSTIDVSGGIVIYKQSAEPYALGLRFYHMGSPCSPPLEQIPEGYRWMDLNAFMVHFTKQFSKPEITRKVPLRLVERAAEIVAAKSAAKPVVVGKANVEREPTLKGARK